MGVGRGSLTLDGKQVGEHTSTSSFKA